MSRVIAVAGCFVLVLAASQAALAQQGGFGTGNWGGSSFSVGRTTFYANGLVANRVGDTSYFNNGLVGRQYGGVTLYSNGLVAGRSGRNTVFSNSGIGVPVRGGAAATGTVYGGGFPYPQGPGPAPFGGATPWSRQPWSR